MKARILVVDDEKLIHDVLKDILEGEGYEVQAVEDAEAAIRLLDEQEFDVALVDILLPGQSGTELLSVIGKRWPGIEVVLITGAPDVDTAIQAVRGGAFDYLKKPFTAQEIINVVVKAFKIKKLNDENKRLNEQNQRYQKRLEELVERRTREVKE